ncbi:MAG: ABC-type nitrate/sulfonate/bicarbonate transport system, permease component, partial [Betaproteobacteria bacterium]|nr:ABC-type nitrate/sulfonate/bicarbonate transport system, permease component [Betaproteobacteria bacterium]
PERAATAPAVPQPERAATAPAVPQPERAATAPAVTQPERTATAEHIKPPSQFGARLAGIAKMLILPIVLIIAWHVAVKATGTRLIPTPYMVGVMLWDISFGGVYDDAYSKSILVHLWASTKRVYGGFFAAAAVGVPLGLLIGRSKLIREIVDPTLQVLRPVPVTAWLPLSMIFFGLGPNAAIFLVFLGAFYPIVLNTTFGVRSVDVKLFEAAAMLGCGGSGLFRQVVLPAASPSIFNGLRLGHGFAWILIVVGEMTGVQEGLGAVIMDARMLSRADLVIAGMVVIGVAGFVTDRVLVAVNNRLLRWSPQHHV